MKNLRVFVIVMFIVNIIGLSFTYAQTYTGTAFLRPEFEYNKVSSEIISGFKLAFTKGFQGDVSCFKRDADQTPNKSPNQILRDILDHLSHGERHITGTEAAQLIRYHTRFRIVGIEYWATHESAYIETGTGIVKWWNPLNSSLFKDRKEWIIAYVDVDGVTVEFIANCGNLCRVKEGDSNPNDGLEQFPDEKPAPQVRTPPSNDCHINKFDAMPVKIKRGESSRLVWETTCRSVEITATDYSSGRLVPTGSLVVKPEKTTDYMLTDFPGMETRMVTIKVTTWLDRNWGWCALGAGVVTGGILYAKHQADNAYSNKQPGHQGESGQTPTTGGTGSQQTWAASYAMAMMHATAQSFATPSFAPKAKITVRYVIHF